ncbi:hypothetical protein J3E69DRAFT_381774 [Trichoderma sp. SZMC 28015]
MTNKHQEDNSRVPIDHETINDRVKREKFHSQLNLTTSSSTAVGGRNSTDVAGGGKKSLIPNDACHEQATTMCFGELFEDPRLECPGGYEAINSAVIGETADRQPDSTINIPTADKDRDFTDAADVENKSSIINTFGHDQGTTMCFGELFEDPRLECPGGYSLHCGNDTALNKSSEYENNFTGHSWQYLDGEIYYSQCPYRVVPYQATIECSSELELAIPEEPIASLDNSSIHGHITNLSAFDLTTPSIPTVVSHPQWNQENTRGERWYIYAGLEPILPHQSGKRSVDLIDSHFTSPIPAHHLSPYVPERIFRRRGLV